MIHVHANGEVEIHSADAPPLGIMPDLPLDDPVEFKLEPGDLFFVASDGFAEAADSSRELFGNDRLIDLLKANQDQPASQTLTLIMEAVNTYTDHAPADDDRTAILIRRLP